MMSPKSLVWLLSLFTWTSATCAAPQIDLASGLTIRVVADNAQVPDCTTVAVDALGRVVASGPGYIRVFADRVVGGKLTTSRDLVTGLKHGAHGLCFCQGDLYYTANNGVWRVRDTDGDGLVDSSPSLVLRIKTGGEHDAHALRMGPDGFWYLICGNGTRGMFALQNVSSPKVRTPRSGVIWRISPDWSKREVWAHGFRNAYDFDFAPNGRIDTFDSDGERDVSLPWYRPTRVFRVAQGDDAGWVSRSWKRPKYDPEMPAVLCELGRGSPTGVMRYQSTRLPERFHRGVFVLDWTFGRIVCVREDGTSEIVAVPKGTAGFAVTDIAELPDGRLVVSVGGRGSRGGLYLIDAVNPGESVRKPIRWSETSGQLAANDKRATASDNPVAQRIVQLRQRDRPSVDSKSVDFAIKALGASVSDQGRLDSMALLIEAVGGLGPGSVKDARGKEQVAAVFDGYRGVVRPEIRKEQRRNAAAELIEMVQVNPSRTLQHEAVRALAVIESDFGWDDIVIDMKRQTSPIEKLHRLIALARIPIPRNDEMTGHVVDAMLEIPVRVKGLQLNVDRNWTQRLGELFVALRRRDSLMPTRLVTHPDFGHPAHLVWTTRMNPEGLEIARRRYLENQNANGEPDVARFIALGDDAVPRRYIRKWLDQPETKAAAWLALSSHPQVSDQTQLNEAALSVDRQVREAAENALKRLGFAIPVSRTNSVSVQQWLAKADRIAAIAGNAVSGEKWFLARQCGKCHNGGMGLGPSLMGVSKRFGPRDLFRSTVDPNHTISDRYQALQVVTDDGKIQTGMKIYQSVDGVTLLTADGQTRRINAADIRTIKKSKTSLMPDGLLDGLTDQQVADLVAYLCAI